MASGERALVSWLTAQFGNARDLRADGVDLGIGDDMAILRTGVVGRKPRATSDGKAGPPLSRGGVAMIRAGDDAPIDNRILVTSDMLMDGVDFDSKIHTPKQIGRKALAVNLSDCAAMAVRPRWAVVSLALPRHWTLAQAKGLYLGMAPLAKKYDCRIVGGDTNSWDHGLVIDVTVMAEPWPGITPVRRDGVRAGDILCLSGTLGGSLAGHHLSFEPRVHAARQLAEQLGDKLHALMDLSDGLSIDAARMAEASGCGIELDANALMQVASAAAKSAKGKLSVIEHVLHDGEDFELLAACTASAPLGWHAIGRAVKGRGLWLIGGEGRKKREAIQPLGWQHAIG